MLIEYGVSPGKIVKIFSTAETAEIVNLWMSVFGKNKQGCNTKAFKWHIFSGGRYPSIAGNDARQAYFKQIAHEFVVLPNDNECAVLTDRLPDHCDLSDYYVFPQNMAWVMAFTHEEGWLGPYFAEHPEYIKLNNENLQLVRKAQQKAEAQSKGWL